MQAQEATQAGAETAQQELSRLEQWIERVLPVYAEYPVLQVLTIVAFFVVASTVALAAPGCGSGSEWYRVTASTPSNRTEQSRRSSAFHRAE